MDFGYANPGFWGDVVDSTWEKKCGLEGGPFFAWDMHRLRRDPGQATNPEDGCSRGDNKYATRKVVQGECIIEPRRRLFIPFAHSKAL